MKLFKNKLMQINITNIYLFLMSFFIISAFIYIRLILKRSEYSLDILKNNVNFYYFLLCFCIACMHLIIFIMLIQMLMLKKKESKFSKILKIIMEALVWKPLDYLLEKISPYIPYSGTIIIGYCMFFRENNFRLICMKSLCFICYFLPKICMSFLFFFEIIFYSRLEYFIKFFWVFIIPYIYIVFINLCEHFYKNNITEITSGLIINPTGVPNAHGVYTAHTFQFNEKSNYPKEAFNELVDSWSILFYLLNLNSIIRRLILKITPCISLLTSLLYFCALSYKIYYLFII